MKAPRYYYLKNLVMQPGGGQSPVVQPAVKTMDSPRPIATETVPAASDPAQTVTANEAKASSELS